MKKALILQRVLWLGLIEFCRPAHSSQAQAGVPLPMEERLCVSVPVKQPLFQDTEQHRKGS